jgi:methyl-accepting chemotaxis protein
MREQGRALALVLRKMSSPRDLAEAAQESKRLASTLEIYDTSETLAKKLIDDAAGQKTLKQALDQKTAILSISKKSVILLQKEITSMPLLYCKRNSSCRMKNG